MKDSEFTPRYKIENIESKIAKLEALGNHEAAAGLKDFFRPYISDERIEQSRLSCIMAMYDDLYTN